MSDSAPQPLCRLFLSALLLTSAVRVAHPDSGSRLTGRVVDSSGLAVPGARVLVRSAATSFERTVTTNKDGVYEVPMVPVGVYRVTVTATGFRQYAVEALATEIGRIAVQDVRLEVGEISQEVTVQAKAEQIDGISISVGHILDGPTVQEIPLNGRHFLDLAVLAPGSVTAAQNGFSTVPTRGLGALAINTAGNREETVNYRINGITLNDLLYSSIDFQPSVSSVQEFKIDNSTLSAEYGQSSGAAVNVATRSGSAAFHGEIFEFLRNDALDARNFFTFTSSQPPPFKRHQFGAALGGPLLPGKTFFFVYYEGLLQSQKVDLNSIVLSDAQRSSITDPVIAKLAGFIPPPNFTDSAGTPRFVGSASAPVTNDQTGLDISHVLNANDRLHGYYSINLNTIVEPAMRGNTVPGFGHIQEPRRQFFSLSETHVFSQDRLNEFRVGLNRLASRTLPVAQHNPVDFGIHDGITQPVGLPQIDVAGGALNFGGPSTFPSGRTDTTLAAGDTMHWIAGRNSLQIGGEFRQFLNNNFRLGSGAFTFPSIAAFLADTASSFSITLGNQSSSIVEGALALFVQSNYKLRPNLNLELGLRYEWNFTPHERYGRFVVLDTATVSLQRLPSSANIYHQNNRNFQPRLGFAWDPFGNGKTSIRAAYAIQVDQPMTSVVFGTAANPPLANPLTFTGPIRLDNAIDLARAAGLAPTTVYPGFDNAHLHSWNFNIQRELTHNFAAMAGYFGSTGTHLILRRNLNQPVNALRPYPAVSASSSILPGTPLGNITQVESTGNSSYNALWLSLSKPLTHGLQLSASYTWSKSLDYNSLSSQGVVVQDSYNLRGDRGVSDFDVRHRFVVRTIYDLPFRGNWFVEDWQLSAILVAQSGNPVNIVTTNTMVNGVAGTLRPDVTGPVPTAGKVDRWFDPSVFIPVPRFGAAGRNVVTGPGFRNIDIAAVRNIDWFDKFHAQFRVEVFDLSNHANFGPPGNVVGTPSFGRINNTRFPTGESGSSRQIQLGVKLAF